MLCTGGNDGKSLRRLQQTVDFHSIVLVLLRRSHVPSERKHSGDSDWSDLEDEWDIQLQQHRVLEPFSDIYKFFLRFACLLTNALCQQQMPSILDIRFIQGARKRWIFGPLDGRRSLTFVNSCDSVLAAAREDTAPEEVYLAKVVGENDSVEGWSPNPVTYLLICQRTVCHVQSALKSFQWSRFSRNTCACTSTSHLIAMCTVFCLALCLFLAMWEVIFSERKLNCTYAFCSWWGLYYR